jgi:hypothetical protein
LTVQIKCDRPVVVLYWDTSIVFLYLFLPVYPQCDPQEQHKLGEAATNDAKPQTLANKRNNTFFSLIREVYIYLLTY